MKKIFLLLFLVISAIATYAQSPSGLPSPRSDSGFAQYNYLRTLGGLISSVRDTNWIPAYPGTLMYWQNAAGADSSLWIFNGRTTGQRFNKVSRPISLTTSGTNGASTLINGVLNIPVYTPQTISLTTTGTGGASTFNSGTGALNIPIYTPQTRLLTVNGSALDLTVDRAFTITTTGVANRTTVTGGAGITPTVDIAATYAGQASITTVGTLISGSIGAGFTLIPNAALANSTISGTALGGTLQNVTFNNSGTGGTTGSIYNGSTALIVSTNTIGAVPTTTTVAGFPLSGNITLNSLIPGTHLSGANYNGSSNVTWFTDATNNNVINTLVSRDANGAFSMGALTATGATISAMPTGPPATALPVVSNAGVLSTLPANSFILNTVTNPGIQSPASYNVKNSLSLAAAGYIGGTTVANPTDTGAVLTSNVIVAGALNQLNYASTANRTINSSNPFTGNISELMPSLSGAGTTITVSQLAGSLTTMSGFTAAIHEPSSATNSQTISHVSALRARLYADNSTSAGRYNITNYYGISIEPSDQFAGSNVANRWGVYQSGINDKNYFAGNVQMAKYVSGTLIVDANGNLGVAGSGTPGTGSVTSVNGVGSNGITVTGGPITASGTLTVTSNATSLNTASTIVSRDGTGSFSAGIVTVIPTGTGNNYGIKMTNSGGSTVIGNLSQTGSNAGGLGLNNPAGTQTVLLQGDGVGYYNTTKPFVIGSTTDNLSGAILQVNGSQYISSIPALGSAATIFLTSNAGIISSRTAAQVLSDIGAAPASTAITGLTGDVSATGPGNVTATIQSNVVTYAKFQQVAASSLVGNPTGALANAQGITLGATLNFTGTSLQTNALSGDITTPANSFVTTLATVNTNVGSWGTASTVPTFTVNGKGLITAAANTSIQIAESQVVNLTTDLAARELIANKGISNGYASLNLIGKVPISQLPTEGLYYQDEWNRRISDNVSFIHNSFGDSFTVGANATPNINGYAYSFANFLRKINANYGYSGSGAFQVALRAHLQLPIGGYYFNTCMIGLNDVIHSTNIIKTAQKIKSGIESLVAQSWLDSAFAGSDSRIKKYGTYTLFNDSLYSGGGYKFGNAIRITGVNDSVQFITNRSNIVIQVLNYSKGSDSVNIYIDNIFIKGYNTSGKSDSATILSHVDSCISGIIYLPNIGGSDSTHIITIKKTSTSPFYLSYIGWLQQPSKCNPLIIGEIPYLDSTGYAINGGSVVNTDYCNTYIQQIIKDYRGFPVGYAYTNTFYSLSNISLVDHVHPNNIGHQQIAQAFLDRIQANRYNQTLDDILIKQPSTTLDFKAKDIYAQRTANTGVVYLGNNGNHFIYFDSTNYNLPSGNLYIGGIVTASANTYSSGNYDILVKNRISNNFESVASLDSTHIADLHSLAYYQTQFQPKENQRLSSTNSPTFLSIIKSGATSTDALFGDGSTKTVTSSTYTPTIANLSNTGTISLSQATYIRMGNIVFVSVGLSCTPTAANTNSSFTVSLPIATATGTQNYIGSGSFAGNGGGGGDYMRSVIVSITSTTSATITYYPTINTSSNINIQFQYTL